MRRRAFLQVAAGTPVARSAARLLGFDPRDLDPAILEALASAILPSAIGADGARRVAREFTAWLADYPAGAEALHGYGTATIRPLGPSPSPRWDEQLRALDTAAQARHGRRFAACRPDEQRALFAEALGENPPSRLPPPLQAPHVGLGLLAWFYESPEATDLGYQAAIGRTRCRPLAMNPEKPPTLPETAR
jgi:hypothetical protein